MTAANSVMLLRGRQPRQPRQARARATVDAIVDAAASELLIMGTPINLTSVAAAANISIGSLYQYFPTHAALVRTLAEHHLGSVGGALIREASSSSAPDDAVLRRALLAYLGTADDPLQVAIMRAIRADPVLRKLDQQDSTRNAKDLVRSMLIASSSKKKVQARIELIIDLAGALVLRLADEPKAQRLRLIEPFMRLALPDNARRPG
jgi:AcrR family transcriptional regulator